MSEFVNAFLRKLHAPSATANITIVSNQPDGICLYGTGHLERFSDDQLRGEHVRCLFSDRTKLLAGPFGPQQPFNLDAAQDSQVALVSSDGANFRLIFTLYNPFNRTYDMNLTLVDDVAYGTSPAIGNNEAAHRAFHVVSLRAVAIH